MKLPLTALVAVLLAAGCAAETTPPAQPLALESATLTTTDAAAEPASAAQAFAWPAPTGWKKETIPFPLGFAPSIPYRGVEEIRFAPRFFDAKAETYFSYSFAFVLDADAGGKPVPFAPKTFGTDLETYFGGLMSAVTKRPLDPKAHQATVVVTAADRFTGNVVTFDGFGDQRRLDLVLEGETFLCGTRRVILSTLSPRPRGDAVWQQLSEQRHSFACSR